MIEKLLCEAFCEGISVRRVPRGHAVGTTFAGVGGDPVGFYVVRDGENSDKYRLEDDATTIAFLEAMGINLQSGTRKDAFHSLLAEYGTQYDRQTGELRSESVSISDLGTAALGFTAMLLRLQDFVLLHPVTVESTFRDDARSAIEARFSAIAKVRHDESIGGVYADYDADTVIEINGRQPVAVYYGTSNDKVNEAVFLWIESHHVKGDGISVVLLLETRNPRGVGQKQLMRAQNYLDAVPVFRGDESNAIDRVARCVESAPRVTH